MSTVAKPQLPERVDNAIYLALCGFYGSNRAVGATEAVWEVLLAQGIVAHGLLLLELDEETPNA